MANTITKTTVMDGSRVLVVNIHIDGDGTGDETNTVLIDASSYAPAFAHSSIISVKAALNGFNCELDWDATANTAALAIPDYISDQCFKDIGGLPNSSGAGKTGDLLLSTTGLGAGDHGSIIIRMNKHNPL